MTRYPASTGPQLGPADPLGNDDLDVLPVAGVAAIGAGTVPPAHPVAWVPRDFNLDGGFRGCRSGAPLRCAARLAARKPEQRNSRTILGASENPAAHRTKGRAAAARRRGDRARRTVAASQHPERAATCSARDPHVKPRRPAWVGGYKRSNDAEYCCQDEPGWFVVAGRNEFSDHASDKPDDDCPKNMHLISWIE